MVRKVFSILRPSLIKRRINDIYLSYQFNRYKSQIERFKNIHKGERCFVIGTGPSLNKMNFDLIKNEILFGVNTLYRGYKKFGINCRYYGVSDEVVWDNIDKEILALDTVLFLCNGAAEHYFRRREYLKNLQKREPLLMMQRGFMWKENKFSKDITQGIYNGDTVVIDTSLQVAYYMGFKKVYLLGCDCDYSGMHRFDGSKTDKLAGGGVSGNWAPVFKSYEICKKVFEDSGREIINATVGGKLEIFKRQSLEEIVKEKK